MVLVARLLRTSALSSRACFVQATHLALRTCPASRIQACTEQQQRQQQQQWRGVSTATFLASQRCGPAVGADATVASSLGLLVSRRFAGHSKWANIKHQKGAADKKRALLFQKLTNAIVAAVKVGNSTDPVANSNLKTAIANAKANDMPNNKIEQAVKIGSGEGRETKEVIFEIAGPGGSQFLVFTEAKSRENVRPAIQRIVNKHGGTIGKDGSAMWAFNKQAAVTISTEDTDGVAARDPEELALEVDAEDVVGGDEDNQVKIVCEFTEGNRVLGELRDLGARIESFETIYSITTAAHPNENEMRGVALLKEKLEEVDEVTTIVVNID